MYFIFTHAHICEFIKYFVTQPLLPIGYPQEPDLVQDSDTGLCWFRNPVSNYRKSIDAKVTRLAGDDGDMNPVLKPSSLGTISPSKLKHSADKNTILIL